MSTFDLLQEQYEKSLKRGMSNEEKQKKFFTTLLKPGTKTGEKLIRILPAKDGTSPFKEVYFHEAKVGDQWVKLWDPKNEGLYSPFNEVYEYMSKKGDKEAINYRAKKYYIVKVIDREHEQEGPKFWRFKHNSKSKGVFDLIFTLYKEYGDLEDPEAGRDLKLYLGLTKSNNGKDYTVVTNIIAKDKSKLSEDKEQAKTWLEDPTIWDDVYAKRPVEYLKLVLEHKVPIFDKETSSWVEKIDNNNTEVSPEQDPQVDEPVDEDLPF